MKQSAFHLLSRWFLARLIIRPNRWKRYAPLKPRLTFIGLQGVISQKIALFILYIVTRTLILNKIMFLGESIFTSLMLRFNFRTVHVELGDKDRWVDVFKYFGFSLTITISLCSKSICHHH
jgi:hypothetical protein